MKAEYNEETEMITITIPMPEYAYKCLEHYGYMIARNTYEYLKDCYCEIVKQEEIQEYDMDCENEKEKIS